MLFIAHTLSREKWSWFYEPVMLEGNVALVKLMGTIEGIYVVLALFGINEPMIDLIIKYYGCSYRIKDAEDIISQYLSEQHVPWPCIDILSLIREPCSLCQVEKEMLEACRRIKKDNT